MVNVQTPLMSVAVLGHGDWAMIPSSSNHEQQQQQAQLQQQEKKASQLFAQRALQERRLKPPDQVIACPRCQSLNTKFCYYNNYSLTQPRHFCKSCRRYWTAGGTLRNVPVGGGCRKNKRTKPRTPEGQNGRTGSADGDSMSVPVLQHPGFNSTSIDFLSSSEGSAFGSADPSMRADSPMCQSTEGGLPMFHPGAQSSSIAQHQLPQPFDSGIPGLNFFRNANRVPGTTLNLHPTFQMPTGDLSEMFDTSNAPRVGALSTLSEGLGTFNINPKSGRDQQSLMSLERWQAASKQHAPSGIWGLPEMAQAQANADMSRHQDAKGKMTLAMAPASGMDAPKRSQQQQQQQQHQQRPTPSWEHSNPQENPGLHYEQQSEQNYWRNPGGWPSTEAFQSSGGGQAL
ncbi:uncharacterized protein [Physcomitrium patens]|nr:dof zinc finger protein DOF1.4-like isoform X2 [Physcomitrium patens]PNR34493.1 hypothetical protein PHYPA_024310 [Physcomitrium patens]|eukprot:XP_024356397.1 dof zinc finger protein DOF1.4-like isoform X2 [Physcomitrella patens]